MRQTPGQKSHINKFVLRYLLYLLYCVLLFTVLRLYTTYTLSYVYKYIVDFPFLFNAVLNLWARFYYIGF